MSRWFAIAGLFLLSSQAFAQESDTGTVAATSAPMPVVLSADEPANIAVTPAPAAPALVITTPPVAQSSYFPALPPSKPCNRQDVDGLWKLKQVYEVPAGKITTDFNAKPHQYLLFTRDETYTVYKDVWGEKGPKEVFLGMRNARTQALQQFVVHESGIVFFYTDGRPVDSKACFIVANPQAPFVAGQMLLMPPEGTSKIRSLRVYDHLMRDTPANRVPTAAPGPRKNQPSLQQP